VTGEDHDTDALIAALTSPALPSERVGEDAAVTAMIGALSSVPARQTGHRSRRGIAIAAVTVASLGVGGLVAAGPGSFFFPAADRSPATGPESAPERSFESSTSSGDDPSGESAPVEPATSTLVARIAEPGIDLVTGQDEDPGDGHGDGDECEAERHGDAVSDVARSTTPGPDVRDTARSDCGKPDTAEDPEQSPSQTAPGQTGQTPAVTAPGQTGESPSDTAPGQTGQTPATTAPGQADESPSDTAPGQTAGTASDTAPGQTDESPSDTAPGQTGQTGNDVGSNAIGRP
jgi:hypothetical protein